MDTPEQVREDSPETAPPSDVTEIAEESLVEDVSIDGMCGVY